MLQELVFSEIDMCHYDLNSEPPMAEMINPFAIVSIATQMVNITQTKKVADTTGKREYQVLHERFVTLRLLDGSLFVTNYKTYAELFAVLAADFVKFENKHE